MEVHDDRIHDSTGYSHSHLHNSLTLISNESFILKNRHELETSFQQNSGFQFYSHSPLQLHLDIFVPADIPSFQTYYKVISQNSRSVSTRS